MARPGTKRLLLGLVVLCGGAYIFWYSVARSGFLQDSAMQGAGIGLLGLALTAWGLAKLVHKVLGVVVFAGVAALGAFVYLRGHAQFQERLAGYRAEEALRDALWPVCNEEKSIAEAAAYDPAAAGVHPVVIFVKQSDGNRIDTAGEPTWMPKDLASTQLVACADISKTTLGECSYSGSSGGGTAKRVQYSTRLRIFGAKDRQLVAETTLQDGVPPECPETLEFRKDDPERILDGGYPDDADIRAFVAKHAE